MLKTLIAQCGANGGTEVWCFTELYKIAWFISKVTIGISSVL